MYARTVVVAKAQVTARMVARRMVIEGVMGVVVVVMGTSVG